MCCIVCGVLCAYCQDLQLVLQKLELLLVLQVEPELVQSLEALDEAHLVESQV